MPLTDAEIVALKEPYGRNQFKVSDGGGLYLLVKSSGRYWKLAYRFDGKQKSLAFGVYPAVTLEDAREKREAAKALLAQNIDPGELKKQQRIEQKSKTADEDKSLANEIRESKTARAAALDPAEQAMIEERRLNILQLLAGSNGYSTNEAVLHAALNAQNYNVSSDRLRTDLAWLYEQHVLDLKIGALWGAHLTQSGLDAVHGRTWIPGIKRPPVKESC